MVTKHVVRAHYQNEKKLRGISDMGFLKEKKYEEGLSQH